MIDWDSFSERNPSSNDYSYWTHKPIASIRLTQVCSRCGSRRRFTAICYQTLGWIMSGHYDTYIHHPPFYKETICYQIHWSKRRSFFACPKCDFKTVDEIKFREHEIEHKLQEKHQEKIRRNIAIIAKILQCKTPRGRYKSKRRVEFTVYRLYRFLNVPINEICEMTKLSQYTIEGMVGRTFKHLCLTDKECAFRSFLQQER